MSLNSFFSSISRAFFNSESEMDNHEIAPEKISIFELNRLIEKYEIRLRQLNTELEAIVTVSEGASFVSAEGLKREIGENKVYLRNALRIKIHILIGQLKALRDEAKSLSGDMLLEKKDHINKIGFFILKSNQRLYELNKEEE